MFQLPRNLRQLYAHSYQSLVWNKVASRRIRELGVSEDGKALVGDLYFPDVPSISKGSFSIKYLYLNGFFFGSAVFDDSPNRRIEIVKP